MGPLQSWQGRGSAGYYLSSARLWNEGPSYPLPCGNDHHEGGRYNGRRSEVTRSFHSQSSLQHVSCSSRIMRHFLYFLAMLHLSALAAVAHPVAQGAM